MAKVPKYIPDTPHGDDFFKIHSQIAEMLQKTIVAEDVSKNSFTLGLLGSWGSGKSLTVGKLREKISVNQNILFIEFDVWKYVDTSLYRSILIDFEKDLRIKAGAGLIPESYKVGIKTTEGKNLHDVLYKSTQTATPEIKQADDSLSKLIEKWEKTPKGKIISFFTLRIANTFRVVGKYLISRSELFYFLLISILLFAFLYYYKSNIADFFPFLKDSYLKPVIKVLLFTVFGFSAIELFKESFKDLFKELLPKTNNNIIITSPPTFAQDQFEGIFKGVVNEISDNGNKKIVIIFDNIDRCESNVTIQILTGLKTFLDQKNCFYLIPCDDLRIKRHLTKTKRAEDDYLDKIFQAYIRIPLIEGDDKIIFIEKCIELADFELIKKDELKISQILTLAYKAETPRQIKRFFNDFISYYRLAEIVDPNKEILLKDIALFTFMIAIKQKWSEVENVILDNPNFFKELENYNGKLDIVPKDCYQFIDNCVSWIDHTVDPANFIYLKNSKNSSNQVQRIFIDNFNEFKITTPLIQQIEKYLSNLKTSNRFILFESGIERLKEIIESKNNEIEEHLLPDLFQVYFRIIMLHNSSETENKKQSFFLSHSNFIAKHIEKINTLDLNLIPNIEKQLCELIRKAEMSENVIELYNSLKNQFDINNIKLIFDKITYDEYIRLHQLAINTNKEKLITVLTPHTIEAIANTLSFNKDENLFIQLIDYLNDSDKINPTKLIISSKISQTFGQIQSHPSSHPYDNFILKALSALNSSDWSETDKNNFNTYLDARLQLFFTQGQNDLGINYCIEGIRNGIPIVQNYFVANGQPNLNGQNIFTPFIERVNEPVLEIGIDNAGIRDNILRISSAYNIQSKVFEKLNFDFIQRKIDLLIYNHAHWLIDLLKQYDIRKAQNFDVNLLDAFEKNVVEKYILTFPDLIYSQYVAVLDQLKNDQNKNHFIEKAVEHFRISPVANAPQIALLINKVNFEVETVMSKIYNNSKMQLIEIDNQELFKGLVTKLSGRDREDYLDRIFIKVNTDLKTPGQTKIILQSISSILSSEDLQNKQRVVVDLIKELFKPSREEADIKVGMELLKSLKNGNRNRNLGVDDNIKQLLNTENKSEALKNELKELL